MLILFFIVFKFMLAIIKLCEQLYLKKALHILWKQSKKWRKNTNEKVIMSVFPSTCKSLLHFHYSFRLFPDELFSGPPTSSVSNVIFLVQVILGSSTSDQIIETTTYELLPYAFTPKSLDDHEKETEERKHHNDHNNKE